MQLVEFGQVGQSRFLRDGDIYGEAWRVRMSQPQEEPDGPLPEEGE